MALSKHVTHYGQLWGFLYYNLTTPLRRIQFCGFEPWKPSPVPTKDILKMNILIFNDDCKIFTEIIIILTLPFFLNIYIEPYLFNFYFNANL